MKTDFKGLLNMIINYIGNKPHHGSAGAAGNDLISQFDEFIHPGETKLIKTGTAMSVPEGHFGMLVPRSSICNKRGLVMANSCGIIDSDYRGEIMVPYRNLGKEPVHLKEGERIAQILIIPVVVPDFQLVTELEDTDRGEGGFGSTGK